MASKIMVEWIEGRAAGKRSYVTRNSIKEGTVAPGKTVSMIWGKSRRVYDAIIVEDMLTSPEIPVQSTSSRAKDTAEDDFLFEMGSPIATSEPKERQHNCTQSEAIIQKLIDMVSDLKDTASDLRDTTERHYSRLLARMDAFERSMEEVKEKIVAQGLNSNSCIPEPANSTSFFDGFSSSPYYEPLAVVNPPLQVPNSHQYMFPLQDMTNKHPRTEDSGQNVIPEEVIMQAMQCCKSRRNLAGRLCNKIFPEAVRQASNCRGVLGKRPLNPATVKAIYTVCLKKFPLDRFETNLQAEKEMRNAIDEACRKTKKTFQEANNEF